MNERERKWQGWVMWASLVVFLIFVGLALTGHADLVPDTGYGPSSDNCSGKC